jgi:hypothetical protein
MTTDLGGTRLKVQQIVNDIDRIEETYGAKLQTQTVARSRVIESAASYTIALGLRIDTASPRIDCADHRQRLGARRMHYVRDAAFPSAAQPV